MRQNRRPLENTLRGSGELGAIGDAVYFIRQSDEKHFRAEIHCVKARDFEMSDSFEIQGRPHINETGDFLMVRPPNMDREELQELERSRAIEVVQKEPEISLRDLGERLGVPKDTVKRLLNKGGWFQIEGAWKEVKK
jgi:hypothetical protein